MTKKSFVLHVDSLDVLDELTNEQAGMLLKAMRDYHNEDEAPLDALTKIVFCPFKNQFNRDSLKYQTTCERRANAGSMGGKQKVANASKPKQKVANLAESVNVSENVSENDSDSVNDSKSDSKSVSVIKETPSKLDYSVLHMTKEQCADVIRIRRKNKGTSLTQLIINQLAKQFLLAEQKGFTFQDSLIEWEVRGWKSFKADWMKVSQDSKPVIGKTQEIFNQLSEIDYGTR
jgi:hypothetical protein